MHSRLISVMLAAVAAGCGDAITNPVRTTEIPAPSGLAVSFTLDGVSPKSTRSIAAAGDSVVVTDQFTAGLTCMVPSASAGVEGGALVVTVVSAYQTEPCYVTLRADLQSGGPFFRATVPSAPRGSYDVIVRERTQRQAGSTTFDERDLARGSVTVR